jgi:hypothetical protein
MSSNQDKTVPMQYVARANVLPEYVRAYLDEGWTLDQDPTCESCEHAWSYHCEDGCEATNRCECAGFWGFLYESA